jgi:hypothetical protein
LRLRFSNTDLERARELPQKANDGALAPNEEREFDTYLNVGRVLDLL